MRSFKLFFRLGALLVVVTTLLISIPSAAASSTINATPAACDRWSIVSTPDVGHTNSNLYSLATISPNDIWSVGLSYPNKVLATSYTLTEHWNGSQWSIISSPNFGSHSNHLYGVAAVSSNDVWTVGSYYIDRRGSGGKTLIEHWNGTNWSIVPSPNKGNRFSELFAVAAVSSNDVWAVGSFVNLSPSQNDILIEHWDGTRWNIIPGANPGAAYNTLLDIKAISANDIWAVGNFAITNGHDQTLTEHWNGSSWSYVPSPNVGRFGNDFGAVSIVSSQDIWAVGSHVVNPGDIVYTLIEHWDGSSWSVVPSPNPETATNTLGGIAAVSSNNIWAVGYDYGFTTNAKTLVEHWDGGSWSVVLSPNRFPASDSLGAVTVVSAHDIWSIGSHITPNLNSHTLSEHYC